MIAPRVLGCCASIRLSLASAVRTGIPAFHPARHVTVSAGGTTPPAPATASQDEKATRWIRTKDEALDLNHLITQPVWTKEERASVHRTHIVPQSLVDRAAYCSVQGLRFGFDFFSLYLFKSRGLFGQMRERDWLRRITFLETVAGVPGMVGGMVRHLHSLRLMRRDRGWIHALLAEAENERMHLLIALNLRKPGPLFRAAVIVAQAIFTPMFGIAYLLCPRYCHRLVGYLEEEAVKTYSCLLDDIDSGKLPLFAGRRAPGFARTYYNLPESAMLRDVFECIRADESHHRDANHHFSDLGSEESNEFVEHLRHPRTLENLDRSRQSS